MPKEQPPSQKFLQPNRSEGLVGTLDHECLIWDDVANKPLRDIIQLSPNYSAVRQNSYDATFEATVKAAGSKTAQELTLADATTLTFALAHNIMKEPSGHEAHYAALMRQVWQHLHKNTSRIAATPSGQSSFTELTQLTDALDSIAPRNIDKVAIQTAEHINWHTKQDINIIAKHISQLAVHMNDKDAREDGFLNIMRKHLKGVRVTKDSSSPDNSYLLVCSALLKPPMSLRQNSQSISDFFVEYGVKVSQVGQNGITMVVAPEKDSMMDRAIAALSKEGKMIS